MHTKPTGSRQLRYAEAIANLDSLTNEEYRLRAQHEQFGTITLTQLQNRLYTIVEARRHWEKQASANRQIQN